MSEEEASGVEAWKAETTAFDRVRSVAETVSEPRSAAWIAEEAAVAENTAREHLARLVDMNVLLESDQEGPATYTIDPLYARAQTLRELLDEHDHDGLIELKEELQERIEAWQTEYDVGSPSQLRELAANTDDVEATRAIRKTASDWELVAYRLSVAEDAIENYATYSRTPLASA